MIRIGTPVVDYNITRASEEMCRLKTSSNCKASKN